MRQIGVVVVAALGVYVVDRALSISLTGITGIVHYLACYIAGAYIWSHA